MHASEAIIMRRSIMVLVVLGALACAAQADERPGIFAKLFSREKPKSKAEDSSVLARLDVKLAKAKSDRQSLARLGADPADLRRMDARVAGLEEMRELLVMREAMQRSGRPRSEVESVEEKIFSVRRNLRKLNDQKAPPKVERAKSDLWSTPRGSRAEKAYEMGSLRKSMGI
jgi:hypothetical protein